MPTIEATKPTQIQITKIFEHCARKYSGDKIAGYSIEDCVQYLWLKYLSKDNSHIDNAQFLHVFAKRALIHLIRTATGYRRLSPETVIIADCEEMKQFVKDPKDSFKEVDDKMLAEDLKNKNDSDNKMMAKMLEVLLETDKLLYHDLGVSESMRSRHVRKYGESLLAAMDGRKLPPKIYKRSNKRRPKK